MKKKICILGIIIILIIVIIILWRFFLEFDLKYAIEINKLYKNIDNITVSIRNIQTEEVTRLDSETSIKIFKILCDTKVKRDLHSYIGAPYHFILSDQNNHMVSVSYNPALISINGDAYNIIDKNYKEIFNSIRDLINNSKI